MYLIQVKAVLFAIMFSYFLLSVDLVVLYRTETQHMVRGISIYLSSFAVVCYLRKPSVHSHISMVAS